MLADRQIERLAAHLATLRRNGEMARFPAGTPAMEQADAYRIQHRLRALLDADAPSPGCKVSGLKKDGSVGGLGVPGPFFARFPAGSMRRSGTTVIPTYPQSGIECELAVRIGLSPDGKPEVRGIMAALELIEMRYHSILDEPLALHLADGLSSMGGVLGEPRSDWPDGLEERDVRVFVNDACIHHGRVGDRIPHPTTAIAAYGEAGSPLGFEVTDGMILFTGNLAREFWIERGDTARAEIDGFAPVEVRFG
jgi:2-keto-4-pentenoate hydratase